MHDGPWYRHYDPGVPCEATFADLSIPQFLERTAEAYPVPVGMDAGIVRTVTATGVMVAACAAGLFAQDARALAVEVPPAVAENEGAVVGVDRSVTGGGVPRLELRPAIAPSDSVPPVRFLIVRDGLWGLIDDGGRIVVQPRFDDIALCAGESMLPRTMPQPVRDAESLLRCRPLQEARIAVRVGDKWGAIDAEGRQVIAPRFDDLRVWAWTGLITAREGKSWGVLDPGGEYAIPPRFEAVQPFVQGLAAVRVGGKWGLVDAEESVVLAPELDQAPRTPDPAENLAVAQRDGRYGLLGSSGGWVVEPTFEQIYVFAEGRANTRAGDKVGYIDSTGAWVIEPRFDLATPFGRHGLAKVRVGDSTMLIDRAGTVVLEGYRLGSLDGGLVAAAVGNDDRHLKWGYLDLTGRWVLEPAYDEVSFFREGLAAVRRDGRTSYVDQDGHIVLQLDCGRCRGMHFSDGLARISVHDKWGYVDRSGTVVIAARYDDASEFTNGLARVRSGDRIAYISRAGEEVYAMDFPGLRKHRAF